MNVNDEINNILSISIGIMNMSDYIHNISSISNDIQMQIIILMIYHQYQTLY